MSMRVSWHFFFLQLYWLHVCLKSFWPSYLKIDPHVFYHRLGWLQIIEIHSIWLNQKGRNCWKVTGYFPNLMRLALLPLTSPQSLDSVCSTASLCHIGHLRCPLQPSFTILCNSSSPDQSQRNPTIAHGTKGLIVCKHNTSVLCASGER